MSFLSFSNLSDPRGRYGLGSQLNIFEVCLLLIFFKLPATQFVSAWIDKSVIVFESNTGRRFWSSTSNYSLIVSIVFDFLIVLMILLGFRNQRKSSLKGIPYFLLLSLGLSVATRSDYWPASEVLFSGVAVLALLAFQGRQWTLKIWSNLSSVYFIVFGGVLIFALMQPQRSFVNCLQSCLVHDRNLTSFFSHENFLGMFLLFGYIAIKKVQNSLLYMILKVLITLTILATGSYLAFSIAIFFIFHERYEVKIIRFIPLGTFLVSTLLFFAPLPYDFISGRGQIYGILKEQFWQNWLFGSGHTFPARALYEGHISFLLFHEHGAGPQSLSRTGIIGWLCMVYILITLTKAYATFSDPEKKLFLFWGLTFATESLSSISLSNHFVWIPFVLICSSKGTRNWENEEKSKGNPTAARDT